MKRTIVLGAMAMLLGTGVKSLAQAPTGSVLLQVEGINLKKGGNLSAGVFLKDNFPTPHKQRKGADVAITGATQNILLTEVPEGTYGAAVFQDINKNGELETNFVGLPKEPIGFSNDARINFGPPSWTDAKFNVVAGKQTTLRIILR